MKKLNCHKNRIINDVNIFADTLEELSCSGKSSINQYGISKLKKIKYLNCDFNDKIYDVNHLCDTLIQLNCFGNSGIDQDGISKLKYLHETIMMVKG